MQRFNGLAHIAGHVAVDMVKRQISDSKEKAEKAYRGAGVELGSGNEQDMEGGQEER